MTCFFFFQDFLPYLFKAYPPKHLPNYPDKEPKGLEGMDGPGKKKVLMKMVTYYHPDKIQKDKHGMKYYVLAEEINKVLSSRYNECKMI